MEFIFSEIAHSSEKFLVNGLSDPGALTLLIVFTAGLITSLGPCSLSLLPITVAYLAGFQSNQRPFIRSASFCGGIIISLTILGCLSGFLGKIFGQIPWFLPKLVAFFAVLMGLNLLGVVKIPIPQGPNPEVWRERVPSSLAPMAAGLAFGLASSPCTTPVLAVLLAWIATSGNPLIGILFLSFFSLGQVTPLLIAGTAAASVQRILSIRPLVQWIPPMSGSILISIGLLTLLSEWI